jgi:hypothetical protein
MRRIFVMSGFIASLLSLLGCEMPPQKKYKTGGVYLDLRQQVLSLDPAKIGLTATSANAVWGVLLPL